MMKPSPHSLNHSLSSLPLPHSLNYISRLCLSPLSPLQLSPNCNSLSQSLSTSLSLSSLPLSLVAVTAHSLPHRRRSSLSTSLPSLLLHRILAQIARYFIHFNSSFFYVNLIFFPIFEGNQVYFSNKNNNQEREREKKNPIHVSCAL